MQRLLSFPYNSNNSLTNFIHINNAINTFNQQGNDTVSIKNRKFLTNNFLTIKEVDSNNKMHIKNEVFNTNIHYESHSTDINSENDDDVFEKPILNSINVTDTIQTAINNQIDDNYQVNNFFNNFVNFT